MLGSRPTLPEVASEVVVTVEQVAVVHFVTTKSPFVASYEAIIG